ncbi:MAG TPA: integrase arm-type DNA-binding domain-containing protein [Micropepsaceae bacterium]|nr:integrase arm-type DNA-binding domain-containing protein [Micropepsaceae bacterium]
MNDATKVRNTNGSLTDLAVKNLRKKDKPYKRSDGGGLYLLVAPDGARYWRMAYRFHGKQKTLALGVYNTVSLSEARDARDAAKKLLAAGADPMQAKREKKRVDRLTAANTFETIAREWHENQRDGWTENYGAQVLTRLEADIFPAIGARPIAEIEPPELLDALRKVEKRGALDVAKRLRQMVGQVFRFGIVTGRAKRDPSADLKGALKASGRQVHHKAMPREVLPEFLGGLDTYDGAAQTRLALRLMVLTFVRTTELRAARWDEFNFETAEWRIPAERMKMREPHIVPLSRQALATLAELRPLAGVSEFVFPSPGAEGFMSNNTMLFAMYRMGFHGRATVHGFRAVASTLLNEMGFNADWIERQLAHDERNKVRGAYNAAQYLPDRRRMMQQWADYLDALASEDKVVPFSAARAGR